MLNMKYLLLIASSILHHCLAKQITISNIEERRDVNGDILRVQDGCLSKFEDTYYLYGVRYQCCDVSEQAKCYQPCGWRNMTFAVYTSPDLESWTLGSESIFPMMTNYSNPVNVRNTAFFESCVMYNRKYDHYVLWFDHPMTKGSAVSKSPFGPFEVANWECSIPNGSDSYYWVDQSNPDDCYLKYNQQGPKYRFHTVAKLTDDWLNVNLTHQSEPIVPPGNMSCSEGGGIFSRAGKWYVMFGACCCFCHQGSNAWIHVSDSPFGPYTYLSDLIGFNKTAGTYDTQSQQFSVAPIFTQSGVVPMYIGQRFGSALDGKKCHDFQYWHPLQFDSNGGVMPIEFTDEFTLDLV
eukprot:TRINITY_DN2208_c3_g1_i4.p1 TRINITY_DN2208_c3_g1~~TRINITY_DN2208_c3_g1_i4.p1  ORF type:complete len:350 (+),score=43.31 TRINITY_DN2208_c3_g1_i4:60-1109(+)